ncbi:MAG: hypothetical protein KA059_05260 [Elusimicrobiales bacterium]|jgi:predicted transcriptional regulator|nr:hypothetical protein [Elusimicrobiales bacterium]
MSVDKNVNSDMFKLRLKHPNGGEIEIEGSKEFIAEQKEDLIHIILNNGNTNLISDGNSLIPMERNMKETITGLIDFTKNIPYIKIKLPELDTEMAIMIILLAYKILQNTDNTKAMFLSKSLKFSGYNPKRIDRTIAPMIKDGSIKAFGTKRNRSYMITEKGTAKATVKLFNIKI